MPKTGTSKPPLSRSEVMRRVKGKDTGPELAVRRLLHSLGYRYRLHRKDLPGSPDIVFSSRKKAIFVHGCYWHGHDCRRGARIPVANREYWLKKISRNAARDAEHNAALAEMGWQVMVVWECEIKDMDHLRKRLDGFLQAEGD